VAGEKTSPSGHDSSLPVASSFGHPPYGRDNRTTLPLSFFGSLYAHQHQESPSSLQTREHALAVMSRSHIVDPKTHWTKPPPARYCDPHISSILQSIPEVLVFHFTAYTARPITQTFSPSRFLFSKLLLVLLLLIRFLR